MASAITTPSSPGPTPHGLAELFYSSTLRAEGYDAYGTTTSQVHAVNNVQECASVLTMDEARVVRAFHRLDSVLAVFSEADSDGVLMVFVVVDEHTEAVYDTVYAAEEQLAEDLSEIRPIEVRIRAAQGRHPSEAVPVGSQPLHLK